MGTTEVPEMTITQAETIEDIRSAAGEWVWDENDMMCR